MIGNGKQLEHKAEISVILTCKQRQKHPKVVKLLNKLIHRHHLETLLSNKNQ